MNLNDLYIVEIGDNYVRENFRKIKDFTTSLFRIKNVQLFEITVTGNKTVEFKHNLGFKPKDVIQTSVIFKTSSGLATTGTLTWNYINFTKDFVNLTTASLPAGGTMTVRALIGNLDGEN